MKKKTLCILSVFVFTSMVLIGCSNPDKRKYNYSFEQRYITITTEPANAKVTLLQPFGQPPVSLGRTPLNSTPVAIMSRLKAVKNIRFSPQAYATYLNNAVVRIELDGYESFYGALKTDKEETLEHHIELQPLSK